MHITFEFSTGPLTLDVELVDNPAVREWAEHFLAKGYQAHGHIETPFMRWPYDKDLLQEYIDKLKSLVAEMELLGYPFTDCAMPDDHTMITREWTNKLHRFFTHTQKQIDHTCPAHLSQDEVVALQKRLSRPLHDINEYVHLVERYMEPEVESADLNEVYISSEPAYDDAGWWFMTDEHRKYHSREHADVIMGSQILGKTILRSYMDNDDPSDWDTSGHYSNGGALQLILGPTTRADIFQREDFINWLQQHGVDPERAWYDFPIGNIVNKEIIPELIDRLQQEHNIPVRCSQ